MRVLAIIVTYNAEPWLDRCLGSLRRQTLRPDVLVLDNASTDTTVARIRQDFPDVTLIENGQNLGFARGNNLGLQQALDKGYDATLLLNADAWLCEDDTLQRLAEAHRRYPDFGILSPVHLTGNADKPEHGFATYTHLTDLDRQPEADIAEAPFIDAAVWFVPSTTWQKVGLFAPLFYHYGEDLNFVHRLHYHGLRIGYLPHTFACHDREFRPASRERFFHVEGTFHLAEYAHIGRSLPSAFAFGVLAPLKKSVKALLAGRFSDARLYVGISLRLLGRTREVLRTRRLSAHDPQALA